MALKCAKMLLRCIIIIIVHKAHKRTALEKKHGTMRKRKMETTDYILNLQQVALPKYIIMLLKPHTLAISQLDVRDGTVEVNATVNWPSG